MSEPIPPPKLYRPVRDELLLLPGSLDNFVPPDHPVRDLWAYVERLDLTRLLAQIKSREGVGGAPAFDPRVLLALWLQATLDGVGSARRLAALAREHIVYRWLSGGLEVNYHTLSDFRADNEALLDELLAASLALMAEEGLIDLDAPLDVAHDSTRVRASAGTSSLRRRQTIEEHLVKARRRVEELKDEPTNPGATQSTARQQAARERAARERVGRLSGALAALDKMKQTERVRTDREPREPRASTTDPEARCQRMANGGKSPAHNIQWTADVATLAIVAVSVAETGTDTGELLPAMNRYREQRGRLPRCVLADDGYFKYEDIGALERAGCQVYVPDLYPASTNTKQHGDFGVEIERWRKRMRTDEARKFYRRRSSTVEWTNACVRQRGLVRLTVRGRRKVRTVALWHAVAHNFARHVALRRRRDQCAQARATRGGNAMQDRA